MAIDGPLLSSLAGDVYTLAQTRSTQLGPRLRTVRSPPRLDRVGDVDEMVAHAEALLQELAQAPHPEGLGRVVAGRDEVDAGLGGLGHRRLGRLAGEEGV